MRKALAICSMLAATGAGMLAPSARADHSCDALGEPGWSTVPSHEIVHVADGPPYQAGGDWLVDRTTTVASFEYSVDSGGVGQLRLTPDAWGQRRRIPKIELSQLLHIRHRRGYGGRGDGDGWR